LLLSQKVRDGWRSASRASTTTPGKPMLFSKAWNVSMRVVMYNCPPACACLWLPLPQVSVGEEGWCLYKSRRRCSIENGLTFFRGTFFLDVEQIRSRSVEIHNRVNTTRSARHQYQPKEGRMGFTYQDGLNLGRTMSLSIVMLWPLSSVAMAFVSLELCFKPPTVR
jgi:hypothetical protein